MTDWEERRGGYLLRIWELRHFWSSLVASDLRKRYKRSFLGVGWSLVRPLLMTALYCVVFGKLFGQSAHDYAPFLLIGLTVWQFLTESILGGCHSFHWAGAYIRQQRVPLAIFPLRTVLGAGFHALVALAVAAVLCGPPSVPAALSIVLGLVLLFGLAWSLAILCGTLRCHFPDVPHLLEVGLQFLMYLTPIIYPLDFLNDRKYLAAVVNVNPMTSVLEVIRTPMLTGSAPAGSVLLTAAACVVAVGLLATASLKRLERTLVFWI